MSYLIPSTISEAIEFLEKENGEARIVAGGTDLIIEKKSGKRKVDTLVDISRIEEIKNIKLENDYLVIGAAVSLTEISESELVNKYFPCLAKGAGAVGCLQIGNLATLPGNVITAQPAADAGMSLAPLDAVFVVEDSEGKREIKQKDLYKGFGKSVIDSSKEMVTYIKIPIRENVKTEYIRLELRSYLDLPMLNACGAVSIKDNKFEDIRITMGPVGVGPVRAVELEKWLKGKEVNKENIEYASKLSLKDSNPRSNPLRGSKEYRIKTLPVIVKRILISIANQYNISL